MRMPLGAIANDGDLLAVKLGYVAVLLIEHPECHTCFLSLTVRLLPTLMVPPWHAAARLTLDVRHVPHDGTAAL